MSFRARLMLWNVVIFTALLVAMGAMLRSRVQARLEANIDSDLAKRARFLPSREVMQLPPTPPEGDEHRKMPPFPLYKRNGKSVRGNRTAPDLASLRHAATIHRALYSTRDGDRIFTLPVQTSEGLAYFQESEPLDGVQQELDRLTRELVQLLPIGLFAAALGAWFLTQRALRPVEALRRATSQIQASDLSQRLTVRGTDEFALLSTTFNEMLSRLETAFERQRQFVADASHELKTPLTIVKGAAEIGRSDTEATEKSRRLFSRIEDGSERMVRLVQSLMVLAQSDSGTLKPQPTMFSNRVLLDDVARAGRALSPQGAAIHVEVQTDSTLGDSDLLYQLLLNLVSNALRYTPPTGSVTLRAFDRGFCVVDTGRGVAAEHLSHLTERFYRVDSSRARKDGGTGLGLAICRSIAEAHGGTLEIESEVDRGTTVRVLLPG